MGLPQERATAILSGDSTDLMEITGILGGLVDEINRKDIIIDDMENKIASLTKLTNNLKGEV